MEKRVRKRRGIGPLRRRINSLLLLAMVAGGGWWGWTQLQPNPLTDAEAIGAIVELRLAQMELGETTPAAIAARDQILARRGVSSAHLERWMKEFRNRPGEWDQIQGELLTLADSLRSASALERGNQR